MKGAADATLGGESTEPASAGVTKNAATTEPLAEDVNKELFTQTQESTVLKESNQNDKTENVTEDTIIEKGETNDKTNGEVEDIPAPLAVEESEEGTVAQATK